MSRPISAPSTLLELEQGVRHGLEAGLVLAQHGGGAGLLLPEDPGDLFVDDPARVLGVVAGVHEVLAEEDHALGSPGHRPHAL